MKETSAVVVSGASTGIGAATAALLAQKGYLVFAGIRSEDDAKRLRAVNDAIRPVRFDVTDRASVDAAIGAIVAGGDRLVGVVANAGVAVAGALEHLPMDALRRQFEVNVFGALALAQAALPHLPRDRGRVVFVGSISGRLAVPYIGPYSASKFALRALADVLRIELAPAGIAVSLIEPGSVNTPIWRKGRDDKTQILATIEGTPRAHYRAAIERVIEQTQAEEESGMAPETVARAIVDAIVSRKPRAQHVLGTPARLGSALALLPPAWRDRFVRSSMRIP